MNEADRSQLEAFLGPATPGRACRLYLPRFTDVEYKASPQGQSFRYAGGAFADRDAKAAMHIFGLVSTVIAAEQVQLTDAADLVGKTEFPGGFVLGSRSNAAAPSFASWFGEHHGFDFDFGTEWAVLWENERFSMPDPSQLDRDTYENQTDYGIVARLTGTGGSAAGFIVAGLGGRATEGCGAYFVDNWKRLHATYPQSDFCVLLKFPPPISPDRSEVLHERSL